MDVVLVLVFVIVFLCSVLVVTRPKNLPPGPLTLPLVGSYWFVKQMQKKDHHLLFSDAAKLYGDIFSYQIGSQLFVVLRGYDAIYQAFVKQSAIFSDRPDVPIRGLWPPVKEGIALRGYSQKWKTLRRFTLQTLRDFGVGKTSIEEKINVEIDAASKAFDAAKGKPLEIASILHNIVGNVIYGIVFGTRFDHNDPKFEMIRKLTNVAVMGQAFNNASLFLPRWMAQIFTRKLQREVETRKQNFETIRSFIFEQVKNHEDTYDENNIRDFVDLYLQATRDSKEERSDVFTEGSMLRVIIELFIAGSETTYNTLDWAFLFIAENPGIQENCFKEIADVVGDKIIENAERVKMPYVEATIHESQRLANIVPIGLQHSTTEKTTLLGYQIPKDTIVLPNLYSALMDPKHWDQPNKFNPMRFIDATGKVFKPDAQMPFGIGPRICLGEPLARMELFLVFASLLQKFKFEREYPAFRHSLERKPNRVTSSPQIYKMRITRREN